MTARDDEWYRWLPDRESGQGGAWIKTQDGSYIQVRHVTRLFLDPDVTTSTVAIKASISGPANPHLIARYENRESAETALSDLVTALGSS